MTAAFLNTGILSGIRKRTDSSFQTALVLSGQDKYLSALLFFLKALHVSLLSTEISFCPVYYYYYYIFCLRNRLRILLPTLLDQLNISTLVFTQTNCHLWTIESVYLPILCLSSDCGWMNEIYNYLASPSSNLDGDRRNLYDSLMSTEHHCCHLIRDLIVKIMNKHTHFG